MIAKLERRQRTAQQNKDLTHKNKMVLGPWIAHLRPGTWVDDVINKIGLWLDIWFKDISILSSGAMMFSQV